MISNSKEALTGFLFVTIVSGLFIVSAGMRIKKNWKDINDPAISTGNKFLSKLGLIFDGIIFAASVLFYLVFILNIGR